MKNELKISTVSIICALCASGISGAYGASSVRTLGGAGTYTSAASASQSGGGTGVARAGSVRVTPTAAGKVTTVKPSGTASATTAGRTGATSRLSLGKYLGGGTAISGGSLSHPGNGSTSTGPGFSSDEISDLRATVEQLESNLKTAQEELRAAQKDLEDALKDFESKQDKLIAGDYITIENGEVFLDVASLGADTSASVKDGVLVLSIAGGAPIDLLQVSDLLTADNMDGVIEDALESKGILTKLQDLQAGVAANKEAIETLQLVSGDVSELAKTVSGKADKQSDAELGKIAVIGDGGQYIGSTKTLDDFYTTAEVDEKIKTDFQDRMTALTTEVTENMENLTQELTSVSNTVHQIVNKDGEVIKIAANSITARELADNSVTEKKLAEAVSDQLVGAPSGEGVNEDGMYVLLVTPSGEHIWADLTPDE